MKISTSIVLSTVTLASILNPIDGHSDPDQFVQSERKLIVGGETTEPGTKTYTTGLRSTVEGDNFCAGSLITPTYVLGASHCVPGDIRWVSIGSHYLNGTQDGEQIRVVSITNHPNYTTDGDQMSNDFVLLKLERPSKFKPVKLAAADGSDLKTGERVTASGWGRTDENGTTSYELQHGWDPTAFGIVSRVRAWIESITSGECSP
ncbi:hypothetical protein PPTG_10492 [Phytophthora nicotianae INRA-310]|uniref:Peptidase S1 domain-containing protein n=1 Tax=Phytophthora nicotianae (strain INRA-310) TaxID=761204 RepID=W2QB25_PHYN3|nr:hypothetical protein PPTG_10492 [Phytophthora nicotianae INRA-310]ETN10347.1 hypothetical protein PPTG_10492 [Phytophthora nicotianae INRA-310]